jgi:hypothetical protein
MPNKTPEQFFINNKDRLIQRLFTRYQKKGVCISINYESDRSRVVIEGEFFGLMPISIDTYKRLRLKLKSAAKIVLERKIRQAFVELENLNSEDFNQTLILVLRATGQLELLKTKDLGWQLTMKHYALRGIDIKD